jgi:hypothetical protein
VAKRRLHRFATVLIMEDYDGSMMIMKELFGWSDTDHRRYRRNSQRQGSVIAHFYLSPSVCMLHYPLLE